jgi:hypothetical protein
LVISVSRRGAELVAVEELAAVAVADAVEVRRHLRDELQAGARRCVQRRTATGWRRLPHSVAGVRSLMTLVFSEPSM